MTRLLVLLGAIAVGGTLTPVYRPIQDTTLQ